MSAYAKMPRSELLQEIDRLRASNARMKAALKSLSERSCYGSYGSCGEADSAAGEAEDALDAEQCARYLGDPTFARCALHRDHSGPCSDREPAP